MKTFQILYNCYDFITTKDDYEAIDFKQTLSANSLLEKKKVMLLRTDVSPQQLIKIFGNSDPRNSNLNVFRAIKHRKWFWH